MYAVVAVAKAATVYALLAEANSLHRIVAFQKIDFS
jgi:hypothetical protein